MYQRCYINKDFWANQDISIPYDIVDIHIELDDRPDTDHWGSVFYDEESKTGIDFCAYPNPKRLVTPQAYTLYPAVDGNIDTGGRVTNRM